MVVIWSFNPYACFLRPPLLLLLTLTSARVLQHHGSCHGQKFMFRTTLGRDWTLKPGENQLGTSSGVAERSELGLDTDDGEILRTGRSKAMLLAPDPDPD